MHIPICFSSDRNYLQHLAVTMASILKNKAESDAIHFYILENDFTDKDRQKLDALKSISAFDISFIQVQHHLLSTCPIHPNDHLSIAAYFRLLIPELIPGEDKIIYLDCDLIVKTSLSGLYEINPGENLMMGVRDIESRKNAKRLDVKRYINSGVLLLNSRKMREDKTFNIFMDFIAQNRHKIVLHDQDVIAAVLQDSIRYIPYRWNQQLLFTSARKAWKNTFSAKDDVFIVHYVGSVKPWHYHFEKVQQDLYFKYLRLTPFSDFEKSYKKHRFYWKLSKIPSRVWRFIKSKEASKYETFESYYLFGFLVFRRKKMKK